METALVLGNSGYLGSVLTKTLLYHGYRVIGADNYMYNQGLSQYSFSDYDDYYEPYVLDITDYDGVNKLIQRADIVFPLAALVGMPICNRYPEKYVREVNVEAIDNIVKCMSNHQILIYPNTNSGYGIQEEECTEETPMNPISLYGRTKCEAENIVMEHPNATVFRLATVFGVSPSMRLDLLVNNLVYEAYFNHKLSLYEPHARRNYIHINDVSLAFIRAIKDRRMMGQVYNLGNDEINMTKGELAEKIKQYLPIDIDYCEGNDSDKRDYIVSSFKLRKTGWYAQFDLDFGIKELIKFYNLLPIDTNHRRYVTQYMRFDDNF